MPARPSGVIEPNTKYSPSGDHPPVPFQLRRSDERFVDATGLRRSHVDIRASSAHADEGDAAAVRRPYRLAVYRGIGCQPAPDAPPEVVDPYVGIDADPSRGCECAAIWGNLHETSFCRRIIQIGKAVEQLAR